MSDDLFLKIISRDIPADIVFENEDVLAFRDVNPQAPLHVLIIPKVRIATINDMQQQDAELFGKLFWQPGRLQQSRALQKMVTGLS